MAIFNYSLTPAQILTLYSNAASPLVTWTQPPPIIYGTALGSQQLDANAIVPGAFSYYPTNGAVLHAGTNALSVTFTPSDLIDYSTETNSVSLVVSRAPLTVATANASRPLWRRQSCSCHEGALNTPGP